MASASAEWEQLLQKHLLSSEAITHAVVSSAKGKILAKDPAFAVTEDELAKLIRGFSDRDLVQVVGITVAGQRYVFLSGEENVLRGKLGKHGVHCVRAGAVLVVAAYEDPTLPVECAHVVEKFTDAVDKQQQK